MTTVSHHSIAELAQPPADHAARFFNRELSWLAFNARVLALAQDPDWPLLERVRFLGIFAANLDEFFMVRVAGLQAQMLAGVTAPTPDGLTPAATHQAVQAQVQTLLHAHAQCFHDLLPELAAHGILLLSYTDLADHERAAVDAYFAREIFPLLTPLVVDSGHPFSHVPSLSMSLTLVIRTAADEERFARVTIPEAVPRLLRLAEIMGTASAQEQFVWLEDVLAAHAAELFPGTNVAAAHLFQVVRDADSVQREAEPANLLHMVENQVRQRRFGEVVGLFSAGTMPASLHRSLMMHLDATAEDVYIVNGRLDLRCLQTLAELDRPNLTHAPFTPAVPVGVQPADDMFASVRQRDLLLHHPYESFQPLIDWLHAAARDPQVLTIKQTLYRVGHDSPVVAALMEACAQGKQVAVLVELQARFDETPNIAWAQALEQAGAQVVYGVVGLKTHCKLLLVVRRDDDGLRSYVHIGTGNYNAATARVYTDLSLLTCDPAISADVAAVFNRLTGYAEQQTYEQLLVAPTQLRNELLALIARETERHRQHGDGRLIFKPNALVDPALIEALYEASQAGVPIELIVRGICCLRPGVPGMSETIRVRSIVGRFLEHSRIYYAQNGGDGVLYLGSADLMPRNLDRRVEVLCPVRDKGLREQLMRDVLDTILDDTARVWLLQADGTYTDSHTIGAPVPLDSQAWLLAYYQQRAANEKVA